MKTASDDPHALRPMRVYEIPPEEREFWDALDTRVSCASCSRRSSPYCTVTNRTHVPVGLLHRCEDYRQRRAR